MSSPSSNTVLVSPPARGRMAGRIRVGLILGFSLFILLGMVVSAGALILPKDNLIADGVRIANLPVGGLTRAAAKQRLAEQWARADDRLVVHAGPHRRDLALRDLGIAPDVDATLDAALALGRQGPPLARLSDAWRLRQDGGEVHPVFTLDAARAEAALAAFGAAINRPPVNASARWDDATGAVVIVPERPGAKLDLPAAVKRLQAEVLPALSAGRPVPEALDVPYREKLPAITAAALSRVDAVLGTYTTAYTASSGNRASNVETAARALHGVILLPGETFSFNTTVGPRDAASGFKVAPVIADGQLTPGMGGGICQVSTTLYNAALLANMRIVQRSHHSLPIHYAPLGQDATVAYGAIDFRFRNTSDAPVIIEARAAKRRLTVRLLGAGPAPNVTILRGDIRALAQRVVTKEDPTLPAGTRTVVEKGSPGRAVTVTRVVGEGPDAVREVISTDRYRGEATVIHIGTAKSAAPAGAPVPLRTPAASD